MGGKQSKQAFRAAVLDLVTSKQSVTALDNSFWDRFWSDPTLTAEDYFTLITFQDVRDLRDKASGNLTALCFKVVEKISACASTACTGEKEQVIVLNCVHLLTRLLPFLFEAPDWRLLFWSPASFLETQDGEQPQALAQVLLNSLADLLFCPDFTVLPKSRVGPEKPDDLASLDSCEYIWEAGIGCTQSPGTTKQLDNHRTAILKLLTTCFSEALYLSPSVSSPMASLNLVERNNYKENFDPKLYLSKYYKAPETPENASRDTINKALHDAVQKISGCLAQRDKVSVLDYSCGPVVCNIISAAGLPGGSEIVLAEYIESGQELLQQWLDRDPSAFDWTPYFRHVVKTLEGGSDQEVTEREERVRSLVKLVHSDFTADPLVEGGHEGPYDLVICFLVLEVSCATIEEYHQRVVRFSSLVKPGGTLLLLTTDKPSIVGELCSYQIGSERFSDIGVSVSVVTEALENAHFDVISVNNIIVKEWNIDPLSLAFICAEKKL